MSDRMRSYPLLRLVRHNPTMASLSFPRPFHIDPGQFVNLWLPGVDEKPFSASNVTGDELEITICAVGPFTRAIMDCKPGDLLGIRGPFGRGFKARGPALLVGGGMGIAPVSYLATRLQAEGIPFTFAAGTRTADDFPFPSRLETFNTHFATEDGSRGTQGRVTQFLPGLIENRGFATLCGCGPEGLLIALKELAEKHNLHYQLAFERYMKCAVGICGQCCLDGSGIRVCTEGPILGPDELAHVTDLGLPHRDATGLRPTT